MINYLPNTLNQIGYNIHLYENRTTPQTYI